MEKINLVCIIILVLFVANNGGTSLSWNIFQTGNSTSSPSNFKAYANQRLAALRNLRNQLYNSTRKVPLRNGNETSSSPEVHTNHTKLNGQSNSDESSKRNISVEINPMRREIGSGMMFRNLDKLLSLTGPIKKMITSKQGIESLASMVMPKRDVLQKLLEIKGHLEPTLKRYLTDTYNGFLSGLIPYSENIGVPPFVLNSMKIPQGLDPRWQLIKSLIKSNDGVEKFIHSIVSGEAFEKFPEVVESRSGDETDLISDQEPDATGQQYRKHQQMYLSSFKKRLMKPGAGRYRLMPTSGGVLRPSLDYENILDQNGQFSQMSYDMRAPDDIETSYSPGGSDIDMMLMSASGYGGRGHGHGHGHGQASYGGFLDPFTILGGLAFLTYLGLMLQNSLNNNNNVTPPIKRGLSFENPFIMASLKRFGKLKGSQHSRRERSLRLKMSAGSTVKNQKFENVVNEITGIWNELEELDKTRSSSNSHHVGSDCRRKQICNIVAKLKNLNLAPLFANRLFSSTKTTEHQFLNDLLISNDLKPCRIYLIV